VTQPTPAVCTAHRVAFDDLAHLRHRCTNPAMPHPTQPHVCACGHYWVGVGVTRCSHCGQARPAGELRVEDDGLGAVFYLCTDRLECARAYWARNQAVYHATLRRSIAADPQPAESQSAGPVDPGDTKRPGPATGSPAEHVAGALGLVDALLRVLQQTGGVSPPGMVTFGLQKVRSELVEARREMDWATGPGHMRQPGDLVRHGMVTGP
jgi:hypothetical protein